jgi:hypothetical protein
MQFALSALGFDIECFGLHLGGAQTANLGDGKGYTDQLFELRQNYPAGGTCLESLIGGNHFRGWKQNGTQANSGAWFWAWVPILRHSLGVFWRLT